MDMWPDDAHVYTGYYYRKAVEPATYMKVLMICLVLGGFMEAVKCLYSAFFANGSGTRKAADLIGAGEFLVPVLDISPVLLSMCVCVMCVLYVCMCVFACI